MFVCAGCGGKISISMVQGQAYYCESARQGFRYGDVVTFDESDWRNAAPDDTDYWAEQEPWPPARG